MQKKKSKKSNRTLVERSPHRTTGGAFVEGITDVDAQYESRNEFNVLNTLLLCHDVYKIASQPPKEAYLYEGKVHHYTPDFLVDTFILGLRIEVKALASLVQSSSALDKYVAIAKSYYEQGIPFAFLVDAQLETPPLFGNVKLLVRYVASKVPEAVLERTINALADGSMPVHALKSKASLELVDIWTMIARRHLCFDWLTALDAEDTVVSLPGQPYGGLKLENILRSTRYGGFLAEMALGRRPSDKRILANAATWRRLNCPIEPWAVVGDLKFGPPIRHLRTEESIPRSPHRRRDFTLGVRVVTPRDTD